MSPVNISSEAEFAKLRDGSAVLVVDFYADWCGPCKAIAPKFQELATKHTKPGRIAFCKVNVDTQQAVASQYGVRAMPTFLFFKNGQKYTELKGADAGKLQALVDELVTSAKPNLMDTPGRTLGGAGAGPAAGSSRPGGAPRPGRQPAPSRPWSVPSSSNLLSALLTFFGLYFVSLFSFDPYKAAENSDYNIKKPRDAPRPIPAGGQRAPGGAAARSSGVRTLADLGGS